MKTLVTLSLTVLILCSACKSAKNQAADQTTPQKQTSTPVQQDQSGKLQKWPADYPVTGDSVAVISVSIDSQPAGDMVAEFYADKAPNHVRNFKWLADHGFYNGVKFHRIVKGFMIQGGDPSGNGTGGPGWNVNAEFNDTPHVKGILSMARASDPNSAGSQFFVCDDTPSFLNGKYTVFGKVFKGIDVLDKVLDVPVAPSPSGENSAPQKSVVMTSVKIVPRSAVK
ncbi:MAG TPA: peptidylprolyl isomerase [bacterium]|jgi:cyclophilin family peptidyl-prolyl cis-trans isomerase